MRTISNNYATLYARLRTIDGFDKTVNNVKVRVRWYYRPEESVGGRRQFHGAKELFLSNHYDFQSTHTIKGICTVHTFKNYTKLEHVGPKDYYCHFEYKPASGAFLPDRVAVCASNTLIDIFGCNSNLSTRVRFRLDQLDLLILHRAGT
ncbi:hypothetical protein BUALT_Bualt18G0018400 [Buddleja alternifolia]|uniref:BAH domain-containing protein n=1 Tax=Buddleja alternifolia TaxID=168488 RepID=A0AAV6W7J0_9LAMI|nr:hypothetical protein BUALT_Bualt18G0018400 [Buddleja alternifolia]